MTIYRRSKELGHVILSINESGGLICVDFFQRPDGSFGFEEYRHDVETAEGWFPIGFHSGNVYASLNAAKSCAADKVGWLNFEM